MFNQILPVDGTAWCLQHAQFKNHTIYWPLAIGSCTTPGAPVVKLSVADATKVSDWLAHFRDVQTFLKTLQPVHGGRYALPSAPFAGVQPPTSLLWVTDAVVPTGPGYEMSSAAFAWVSAGFDAMDKAQTLIRQNMGSALEGPRPGDRGPETTGPTQPGRTP